MENEIIFFDLETTGTNTSTDKIVEISAIKYDLSFNELERKYLLINPGCPIPKEASDVHGITDEKVAEKPLFASYSKGISSFFSNCIIAGFNIKNFDVPLLSEELARCGIDWPSPGTRFIDAYKIFIERERRDLSSAVKFYTGKTMEGAHQAENDNIATMEVLQGQMFAYDLKLEDCIVDEKDTVDLAGKLKWKDNEICFAFGKNKDIPVKSDVSYALWMVQKGDFSSNTKKCIKSIFNGTMPHKR